MTTVTHIVPLFVPVIDGVGDYALNLARALRARHNIDSRFVVCDPTWRGAAEVDGFSIRGPEAMADRGLKEALAGSSRVILHYVGYGYHPKGVPQWLIDSFAQWKCKNTGATLLTVFHEIWSSGPPWKSAFYLKPVQRKLVFDLLELSSHAFVSTQGAFKQLNAPGKVTPLPVSANVHPLHEPTPHPRGTELYQPVIFGMPWTRLAAVKKHAELLRTLHAQRLLDRVLVAGYRANCDPASEDVAALRSIVPNEKISVLGELDATEAAEVFDRADFLLSPTPAQDLCKSSAAMSAFACECPVVVTPSSALIAPLQPQHFVVVSNSDCELRNVASLALRKWNLQRVATHARAWFLQNATWPALASKFEEKLAIAAPESVAK